MPPTFTLAQETYFVTRTEQHIKRVRNNLIRIYNAIAGLDRDKILEKYENHDQTKYSLDEYEGYVLTTEKYRPGSDFKPTAEQQQLMDEAWEHHKTHNRHHPEFFGDNLADMEKEDLAEMVADWAAMSQEKGDSLVAWAKKVLAERFKFTEDQQEFIWKCVNIFDEVK